MPSPTAESPAERARIAVVTIGDDGRSKGHGEYALPVASPWLQSVYELVPVRIGGGISTRAIAGALLRARAAVAHVRCEDGMSLPAHARCLRVSAWLRLPTVFEVANRSVLDAFDRLDERRRRALRRRVAAADVSFVGDDDTATEFHRRFDRAPEIVAGGGEGATSASPCGARVTPSELDLDDVYQRALHRSAAPSTRARRFFLRRLRQMSAAELAHRVEYALRRRRAAARLARRRAHVARALQAPGGRRVVGLVPPDAFAIVGERLRTEAPAAQRDAVREAERLRAGERVVYGAPMTLPLPIAYDRDPITGFTWPRTPDVEFTGHADVDVKAVWEIGKLADLARLAWLGRVLDRPDDVRHARMEAERFVREHPRGTSPHWVSPLEVAIRLLSVLWIVTCSDGERTGGGVETAALVDAAAAHLDFVYDERSVFRDPNNHLIGEAVALVIGGLVLPGLADAATYVREGLRILTRELPRQLDETGCSREGSIDYHREVAEWLLQAALVLRRRAPDASSVVAVHLERALACGTAWMDAAGRLPLFGDTDHARVFPLAPAPSADGRIFPLYLAHGAPQPPAIAEACDPLLALTIEAMNGTVADPARSRRAPACAAPAADAGGIHRASDPAGLDLYFKTGGAGLLPQRGHAHADLLALQLHSAGVARITDAGTHCYGTSASRRYVLRSARHHATLYLPPDQADPLDLFKWATDPTPGPSYRAADAGIDVCCASHDGYARAHPGAIHRREVARIDGGVVIVVDRVEGTGRVLVVFPYPLPADVRTLTPAAFGTAGGRIEYADGTRITIAAYDPALATVVRRGGPHGSHSPRYGELHPVYGLELAGHVALPLRIVTVLHVAPPGAEEPRQMRVDHSGMSVHIDCGHDEADRSLEYTQQRDGTRYLRVSERGNLTVERVLKLPAKWGA